MTRQLLIAVVSIILVGCATLWARAAVTSHNEYAAGMAAIDDGDADRAAVHLRHAMQWYAPVGSRVGSAYDELIILGDELSASGDVERALFAYRSARAGVMSIRGIWRPLRGSLPELHAAIGDLMAIQVGEAAGSEQADTFSRQLDNYRERQVNGLLSVLASLSFLAWLLCLIALSIAGFDTSGRLRRAKAAKWAGATAVTFCVWIVCAALA